MGLCSAGAVIVQSSPTGYPPNGGMETGRMGNFLDGIAFRQSETSRHLKGNTPRFLLPKSLRHDAPDRLIVHVCLSWRPNFRPSGCDQGTGRIRQKFASCELVHVIWPARKLSCVVDYRHR